MKDRVLPFPTGLFWLGILLLSVVACGCAVRRITRVQPPAVPPPGLAVSPADLVARINAWSEGIQTLKATVDLEPTAGSVYSGVIKEYHDVRGFILLEKPAMIRIIGQAPIVRTQIFDMVSDGQEFRLYVAPKQKFIVGKTATLRPSKNSLENLRPQHILNALLIPPVDANREKSFPEEAEDRRSYVITVVDASPEGLALKRKVWLSRSNLEVTRLQLYGPQGAYSEDVQYSQYQDFQGIRYPTRIEISRPLEDYRLAITIQSATFNEPLGPEKFELKKPASAQLVELAATAPGEEQRGQ